MWRGEGAQRQWDLWAGKRTRPKPVPGTATAPGPSAGPGPAKTGGAVAMPKVASSLRIRSISEVTADSKAGAAGPPRRAALLGQFQEQVRDFVCARLKPQKAAHRRRDISAATSASKLGGPGTPFCCRKALRFKGRSSARLFQSPKLELGSGGSTLASHISSRLLMFA